MSDGVLVALITVVGGLLASILKHFLEKSMKISKETRDMVKEVKDLAVDNKENILNNKKNILKHIGFSLLIDMERDLVKGYTDFADNERIGDLYKAYTDSGGNGRVEMIYKKYDKLPIKKGE